MSSPHKPLFTLEMANNHMGEVEHGVRVIESFAPIVTRYPQFDFAFKLQYRDLDTFIEPSFKGRADIKYVKRFEETRLSDAQFLQLLATMRKCGFQTMCTPFDEASVPRIAEHGIDILKIASASMTDWPLLECIAQSKHRRVVMSTGGAIWDEVDRTVSFLLHRGKELTVMHCVAEYPTADDRLQLHQIRRIRERYPDVVVGYSTHEEPDNRDAVQVAIALGARVFEKHVGVPTSKHAINGYSASPEQVDRWLASAARTFDMMGMLNGRPEPTAEERSTLRSLQRGVWAMRPIARGQTITLDMVRLAIPTQAGQLVANDMGKYTRWVANKDIAEGAPIGEADAASHDVRADVQRIARRVKELLRTAKADVPGRLELEISHHYGIERFDEVGICMLTIVNRTYCKKLIVVLPGQVHPTQYHKVKEETFHVLWGDLQLELDGQLREMGPGDISQVDREVRHRFTSRGGCVIEELSSTHAGSDSFYEDEGIMRNPNRKTYVTHWLDA